MSNQKNSNHPAHKPQDHPAAPGGDRSENKAMSGRKALLFIAIGLVLAVILAVLGIVPRLHADKRLQQTTDADAAPNVTVAYPLQGKPEDTLLLPGALQAYVDSPIYARTSGYLAHWYFDIGAHVRKGQLLAVISSPEVDQQLAQAKANLATAQATARNAAVQAKRYQDLLAQNAVSQVDTDNFTTSQLSTNTQVQAAQASVQQYQQLVGFERVYAPFDGVITARDIDNGQLINAGAATNQQLFEEAQVSTLRVYVSIPQVDSLGARRGTAAQVMLGEYPGQTFTGHIVRTANAIDPNTRTLLVEIDVDNRDGKLMPGAYGEVQLHLNTGVPTLVVPVPAMIFRAQGLQLAVVRDGKVKLVAIGVGQDDGKVIQVVSGVTAQDAVIQNPPDSILDGEAVHVVNSSFTSENSVSNPKNGPEGDRDTQQQTGGENGRTANSQAPQTSAAGGSGGKASNGGSSGKGGGK
jgi:RND family efflux transporter MFP subunit